MTQASTLAIRRDDGIADFERHLRRPDLSRRILALPTNIRGGGPLGRSVGLAQLVLTWAQRAESPRARTYIANPGPIAFRNFVSPLYGFAAAYFSHSITPRGLDDNIRMDLMRSSRDRIVAMSEGDLSHTAKGRKVEFILVHGARNQFHRLLYTQTPTQADLMDRERHGQLVIDPRGMTHLLRRCMDDRLDGLKVSAASKERDYLLEQLKRNNNPLGQLLHESFRNTAEHAYLDANGEVPSRGMRSLTIAVQQVDREQFTPSAVISSDQPRAGAYFDRLRGRYRSPYHREHIDVLEISVLDSGPGFAQTISRTCTGDRRAVNDVGLVARCFEKHQSAKSGSSSGIGLNRILESIYELGGFMRLRTSTTESFFAGSPDYSPTMDPRDFVKGDLAEVQGTSLTVSIPLVY